MTRVAVVGLGYVGLTSAACLCHLGHKVAGVDTDAPRVESLRRGEIPILEEGLAELVAAGLASGRLSFGTSTEKAVVGAEVVFLCVPTPQGADGSADLTAVLSASHQLAEHLAKGAVVVTKSTVPVGSAGAVVDALGRPDVAVVSNPEFLREGHSVADFLHPERIVVGA
ncbi:MAG: NAD(P)-binding domain-containing protein, partial [Acidimicrobiales bacterium]